MNKKKEFDLRTQRIKLISKAITKKSSSKTIEVLDRYYFIHLQLAKLSLPRIKSASILFTEGVK